MKKTIIEIIIFIVVVVSIISLIAHFWNGGICPKCNIEFETQNIIEEGNERILFRCPNCERCGNIDAGMAFYLNN